MKWGDRLAEDGTLRTPSIIDAFNKVKRVDFLPDQLQDQAVVDRALPVGEGQTNSQPTVVAQMLEWLEPRKGQKILDVGSGSGWTSALLKHIVGASGRVVAVEKVPLLLEQSKRRIERLGLEVEFHEAESSRLGWPKDSPYDRILVSAVSNKDWINELLEQLTEGGIMVIPVVDSQNSGQQSIHVIYKQASGYDEEVYPGYLFVPLIKE